MMKQIKFWNDTSFDERYKVIKKAVAANRGREHLLITEYLSIKEMATEKEKNSYLEELPHNIRWQLNESYYYNNDKETKSLDIDVTDLSLKKVCKFLNVLFYTFQELGGRVSTPQYGDIENKAIYFEFDEVKWSLHISEETTRLGFNEKQPMIPNYVRNSSNYFECLIKNSQKDSLITKKLIFEINHDSTIDSVKMIMEELRKQYLDVQEVLSRKRLERKIELEKELAHEKLVEQEERRIRKEKECNEHKKIIHDAIVKQQMQWAEYEQFKKYMTWVQNHGQELDSQEIENYEKLVDLAFDKENLIKEIKELVANNLELINDEQ